MGSTEAAGWRRTQHASHALGTGTRLACCATAACLLCACASSRQGDDAGLADPQSPAALESHLAAADRLLAGGAESCLERLDRAASQLDALTTSPVFAVVIPRGAARLAAMQYRIHRARADCVTDAAQRAGELRQALAHAGQAVAGFREGFDYQAMVIMQYNLAVTLRALGDDAASVAELESAIAMDREYGFDEDAQQNRGLLRVWQGLPDADTPPPEVSQRITDLKFAWVPCEAQVELTTSLTAWISGDRLERASASRTVQRHVRRSQGGGWVVLYSGGDIVQGETPVAAPEDELETIALSEVRGLMELPAIQISAGGEFQHLTNEGFYANRMQRAALGVLGELSGGQEPSQALSSRVPLLLSAETLTGRAEEDYNMQTAAWNGTTLEQGVWYSMNVQLMMPGIPSWDVTQELEFAYTRQVPCVEGEPPRCVEIVVHARPEPEALAATVRTLSRRLGLQEPFRYWSATYMRLVVDPDTLTPYVRDARRYWYFRCGAQQLADEGAKGGGSAVACDSETASERMLWRASAPPAESPAPAGQGASD